MQRLLTMETYTSSIRSEAYGWGIECGSVAKQDFVAAMGRLDKFRSVNQVGVGYVGHPKGMFHCHSSPLHALAAGWRLMAPPTKASMKTDDDKYKGDGGVRDYWEWWFEKTSPNVAE